MVRLIDADELKKILDVRRTIEAIDNAPTVDAVEVVRCKDCRIKSDTEQCPYLQLYKIIDDNGYCSCGERKDK